MLLYIIFLCVLVAIIYLIQFKAYGHSRHIDLEAVLLEKIGLPLENELEYGSAVEEQLAGH